MDALILSRIQFALNITFHILFPTISIALGWFLLFFRLKYNKTKEEKWLGAYKLWVKIFALTFTFGVVSGITMSFQFGTNWPGFMEKVGNIAGPLLAYEVLSAFFLEATFLGIMLYGLNRVSSRMHILATFLVAASTTLSAFWIVSLNSWMHTPAGFKMIDGKAHATNWLDIIFNPSMPYHLSHMLVASVLTAAFFIIGISAYRHLRGDNNPSVFAALKVATYVAAVAIPLQIVIGDLHGLVTLKYQPAKIAAMEGLWQTESGPGLVLFAFPDEKNKMNHWEVKVPKLASIILTHTLDGTVRGLNEFVGEHPPVAPVFFSFRVMVGVGLLMLLTSWFGSFYLLRNKELPKWFMLALVPMTFSGWFATVAGWYTTEIGRQPWLVHGVLKTSDAVAKNVSGNMVASSLSMYLITYVVLLTSFVSVVFYLASSARDSTK